MSKLSQQTQPAIEKLLESDEDQLFEKLGMTAKSFDRDLSVQSSFDPAVKYDKTEMGLMDDLRRFGARLFRRWNNEAYKLICGKEGGDSDDREEFLDALGINEVAAGAALAALLVTQLGLSAAIAAIVASIVIKRFFTPTYDEFCKTWQESLK